MADRPAMAILRGRGCPLEDCDAGMARGHLVCRKHWYEIPVALRDEVWRTLKECGVLSVDYNDAVANAFASIGYDEDGNRA